MSPEQIRNQAKDQYCDETNDIAIYDDAEVEKVEGGHWVQAYVWVSQED